MPGRGKSLLMLIIMDGWGLREGNGGNAIRLARTPNMDYYSRTFPFTRLAASGEAVGLPGEQMGNSEVGHLNLGAGRIVYQDILRIGRAIEDGSFFSNSVLLQAMEEVRLRGSSLHLMGLLSDGGVHSHNTHLYALLKMAKACGVHNVFVHAILDGRDTPPSSAVVYLDQLEREILRLGIGRVAGIAGRYWSMDRDRRWDRTEKAYFACTEGRGRRAATSREAIEEAYGRGETDEFVLPTVIADSFGNPLATIKTADVLLFFNFRADRARQISKAFLEREFLEFDRGRLPPFPSYASMTEYDAHFHVPVVFPPEYLTDTLGEVVAAAGLRQLRIAETEKYAHVTYFFSGGVEKIFPGEERILVPSPNVATYDLQPEMSAPELTREMLKVLDAEQADFIVLNFANADMVGHTGKLKETIQAVETVDYQVGMLVEEMRRRKGAVLITSDHGNAEKMMDGDGTPHTAHTNNDTPLVLITPGGDYRLPERGKLSDVAPTILRLLNIPIPAKMSGISLI